MKGAWLGSPFCCQAPCDTWSEVVLGLSLGERYCGAIWSLMRATVDRRGHGEWSLFGAYALGYGLWLSLFETVQAISWGAPQ